MRFPAPTPSRPCGSETRLGISVGRKVGGAVERNSVKRALREAFWGLPEGSLPPHHDFVLVARPDAGGLVEREGTPGAQNALAPSSCGQAGIGT